MTAGLARRHSLWEATIDNWKAKDRGLEVFEVRWIKELESENAKLKRLLADARPDQFALRYFAASGGVAVRRDQNGVALHRAAKT